MWGKNDEVISSSGWGKDDEVIGGATSPSSTNEIPSGIGPDGKPIYPSKYKPVKEPSTWEKIDAAAGAIANNAIGMGAYVPATVGALLNAGNEITQGRPENTNVEKNIGAYTEALMNPITKNDSDLEKEYTEKIGKFLGDWGIPAGAVGHTMPPVSIRPSLPRFKGSEADVVIKVPDESQSKPMPTEQMSFEDVGSQAPQYGVKQGQGHWVTDENGIPVRADLSLEASNLENPLQRNLWGDELARKSQQEGIPLTEAIDSMPWAQRRGAINRELANDVPASGELLAAKMEAEGQPKIQGPGEFYTTQDSLKFGDAKYPQFQPNSPLPTKRLGDMSKEVADNGGSIIIKGPNGKETSTLNMAIFDPTFKETKDLANGVRLVFQGDEGAPYIKAFRDGKEIGQLKLQSENIIPDEKGNLQAAWVNSSEPGLAKEMYKFAAEQGNDIVPAKIQTPGGKAMWDSFTRQGLTSGNKIKAIREMADEIRSSVSPDPIPGVERIPLEKTPIDSYQNIPGMKEATKDHIPSDPDVKSVIEQAKSENGENGKIILKSLRAGAGMVGEQRNSAVVKATGRFILNGVKRAEQNIRAVVEPFEKSIGKLTSSEVDGLGNLLKEEMFDGVQHTIEQLSERGMSPKSIEAYQKTRDMFTKVLQEMNEARLEMGMEPVKPREAYLSSRWTGSFRIPVYDKSGKLVWYIAETSKRKAENALEYLSKNGVDVDRSKSKLEFAQYGEKSRGSLEDAYLTMLEVLDKNDPRVKEVQSIMEDAMANHSYDTLGQKRHFEPKGNIRGFVGDRPWRDTSKESYAMLRHQAQYAKNGFQWAESQRAVSKVKEILSDPDLMKQQPNNLEYARQYVKNHLGYGENQLIRSVENTLSKALGIDKAGIYDAVGMAKGLFLTMKLTANIGYYISQGLQMLNSIPEHAYLDSLGYKHNPFKTTTRANLDFSAGITKGALDILSKGKSPDLKMSKIGKDAWNYMEQNGISNRNILDEAQGLGEHKIAGAIKSVADYPVAKSEQIIRTNTFLQFVHHLDQSGKFTNLSELFQKAEEATNRSMVDFRREERAMLFSQLGVTGRAAETLKSYLVNYYNNLGRYSQEALKGRPKALAYFLGIQALLYGAMNVPGATEINDGWDLIKKSMPDAIFDKIKDIDVKKFLIEHMGDYAYGGVSKLTGTNLSNRGNVALDQSFALDGLFPFITDAYKQAKAVGQAVINPNQATLAQAAYQVAPSGPIQGNIAMSEPFQVGKNANGETIFQKPSKLVEHEHDFDRNSEQITKKKWGFTDLQEAKYKDLTYLQNQDEADFGNRRKQLINKIFDSMVRGDESDKQTYIKRYINFNGDPDQLVANLTQEAYKMRVSPEKLQAISSSSVPALKKIQALQQLVGQIK